MSATTATPDDLSHADHAHEHAHPKQSFLWKYIFSTDHKMIGLQYGICCAPVPARSDSS